MISRRTAVLAALASLCVAPPFVCAAPCDVQPRPALFCAQPLHDFGTVLQGAVVEHTFLIENRGTAPLHLSSLVSSCSCTTAPLTREVVPPAGRVPITLRFDSAQTGGEVHKSVLVMSDDPERPQFPLEISGIVESLYEADPPFVVLPRLCHSRPFAREIVVRGRRGAKPRVWAVAVEDDPGFEAGFRESAADGEWIVTLSLKPGQTARRASGAVLISLNDPVAPALLVRFSGRLYDDLDAFPRELDFGSARPGEPLSRKAFLLFHHPQARVLSVRAIPACFEVTLKPRPQPAIADSSEGAALLAAERGFEIDLKVKRRARPGLVRGRIEIRTSSPEQPLVVIPLSGSIKNPGAGGKR